MRNYALTRLPEFREDESLLGVYFIHRHPEMFNTIRKLGCEGFIDLANETGLLNTENSECFVILYLEHINIILAEAGKF